MSRREEIVLMAMTIFSGHSHLNQSLTEADSNHGNRLKAKAMVAKAVLSMSKMALIGWRNLGQLHQLAVGVSGWLAYQWRLGSAINGVMTSASHRRNVAYRRMPSASALSAKMANGGM